MNQQTLNGMPGSNFNNSYLMEKKFEVMLDTTNRRLIAEITKIKEALASLQDDVNKLKTGYAKDSRTEIQRQNIAVSPGESGTRIIRPGYDDINPEDVSVEKMFYFGNRR